MAQRPGWLPVAALLVLATCVQAWTMSRSAVPAQDSVRFVAYARAASIHGWSATMTDRNDAPIFPAIVGLLHGTISAGCHLLGSELPDDIWATSVTWGAAIPLILSVVPLYFLLARVFDPRVAGLATALFCVLPTVARLGADGLSDSTNLFLVVSAVWAWMAAEDAGTWRVRFARWSAAGACLGLACLTRIEALALVPAMLISAGWRDDAKPRAAAGAALALGMLVWLVPYTLTTGKVTPKHTLSFLMDVARPASGAGERPATSPDVSRAETPDELPRSFDPKDRSTTSRRYGYVASLEEFCRELPEGWSYVAGLLSLAGLCIAPRSQSPAFDRLVLAFLTIYLLAAIQFAAGAGYLASRHFLLPAILTLGWAGVALQRLLSALDARFTIRLPRARWAMQAGLLAAIGLATLAPQFKSLRASRLGYRQAGEWLAATAAAEDTILDTRQWTALYSGRATYGADSSSEALADPRLKYLVVEQAEIERDSPRARVLRTLIESCGSQTASFASNGGRSRQAAPSNVLIYAWNPSRASSEPSARRPRAASASHRPPTREK